MRTGWRSVLFFLGLVIKICYVLKLRNHKGNVFYFPYMQAANLFNLCSIDILKLSVSKSSEDDNV